MAESLSNFLDRVSEGIPLQFSGEPWYNPKGDCIHYHWRNEEYYRDWLDDKLTIYRSISDDSAVGCQIKGINALINKLGEFGIGLNTAEGVPLAMFLFASHVSAEPNEEKIVEREQMYQYIMGLVKKEVVNIKEVAA